MITTLYSILAIITAFASLVGFYDSNGKMGLFFEDIIGCILLGAFWPIVWIAVILEVATHKD